MKKKLSVGIGILSLMMLVVVACGANAQSANVEAPSETNLSSGFDQKPSVGAQAYCPVMKHKFVVSENSDFSTYKGKIYVFCCPGCKPKFDKNPEQYLKREQ